MTERGGNRGGIAKRAYNWSWLITRGKLVTARLTVMFKTQARWSQIAEGHKQVVQPVVPPVVAIYEWSWPHWLYDWSCNWSYDVTTGSATSCDRSWPVAWPYDWSHDRSSFTYKKVHNQASGSVSFLSSAWTCAASQSRDAPSTGTFSSVSFVVSALEECSCCDSNQLLLLL